MKKVFSLLMMLALLLSLCSCSKIAALKNYADSVEKAENSLQDTEDVKDTSSLIKNETVNNEDVNTEDEISKDIIIDRGEDESESEISFTSEWPTKGLFKLIPVAKDATVSFTEVNDASCSLMLSVTFENFANYVEDVKDAGYDIDSEESYYPDYATLSYEASHKNGYRIALNYAIGLAVVEITPAD